ncbi:MAG: prolipoprotein diacylglyceryl transferase [bacterium]|nr:prolipoprotein diacylglyceryl transferase [bacterium]
MLPYPDIDPVFLRLGPFQLRWYGLMYVIGIMGGFQIARRTMTRDLKIPEEAQYNMLTGIILGVLLGGRLGYILFYDLSHYLSNPVSMVAIWQGGMSYHGAAIGAALGLSFVARRAKVSVLPMLDLLAWLSTIGIGLGRIANFINGELYGRVTDVAWAMVFPAGGPLPRHPSQLYESFGEGLVLFLLLWWVRKRFNPVPGALFCLYLIGYGVVRFMIEFVRNPDAQLGTVLGVLTMGQLLCITMIVLGAAGLRWLHTRGGLFVAKGRS